MENYIEHILKNLPFIEDQLRSIKEVIISNIILLGQTPSPTFAEGARAELFLNRLADGHADECTTDDFGNPIGIIKGTSNGATPPIFAVGHLDTAFDEDVDYSYIVRKNSITGPGLLDNTVSVGVLASLPVILKTLGLSFESDIVLPGVIQSIGKGNLAGMRHLLDNWSGPVRGGVILEGEKIGRLNYYSEGIIRGEVNCRVPQSEGRTYRYHPNAILVLNELINEILSMRLPQRPHSRVIIGRMQGGFKHGLIAYDAQLGFEIQSDSDEMVRLMFDEIQDIVDGLGHEHSVDLEMEVISTQNAATLRYRHSLVKTTVAVMKRLGLKPFSESSESELSIFLSKQIPAVTLGLTTGKNIHTENATMKIDPMFKGIAQVIGVLMAIDNGVCDEL
ncbi:MAG: hypothetical protein ACOC8I_01570 [Desulfosalsimonas sp.]